MNNKYINISISIIEEVFNKAFGIIYELPAIGIEEKFDEIIVTFDYYLWNNDLRNTLTNELLKLDPNSKIIKEEILEDRNWNEEFEKQAPLIIINERIGIAPAWKIDELMTPIKIIINPKMAFGTGEHATTKMMCLLLEKNVKKNDLWIDAGCGTGLLSILAIKLGSRRVFAFDYDEWSVENTKENISFNEVNPGQIEVLQDTIEDVILPQADGIVANMFSNLLITSMTKFYFSLLKSEGSLLVSGILKYDKQEVINSAIKNGFSLVDEIFEDEWVALHFKIQNFEILKNTKVN